MLKLFHFLSFLNYIFSLLQICYKSVTVHLLFTLLRRKPRLRGVTHFGVRALASGRGDSIRSFSPPLLTGKCSASPGMWAGLRGTIKMTFHLLALGSPLRVREATGVWPGSFTFKDAFDASGKH
jgi:hypothetical protein